jgi:hypothetical protein
VVKCLMRDADEPAGPFSQQRAQIEGPADGLPLKGVKLQGVITWFDTFSLLLRRDGHTQLVYKHSVSTIMPARPLAISTGWSRPTLPRNPGCRTLSYRPLPANGST